MGRLEISKKKERKVCDKQTLEAKLRIDHAALE
jgi:hypothetical protein